MVGKERGVKSGDQGGAIVCICVAELGWIVCLGSLCKMGGRGRRGALQMRFHRRFSYLIDQDYYAAFDMV